MVTRKGRRTGKPNYKNDSLLEIINSKLPCGMEGWKEVCLEYKYASGEELLREAQDVRRHFYDKLCNKLKKVTRDSGANSKIRQAQDIYAKILRKESAMTFGEDDEDDEDRSNSNSSVNEDDSDSESENDSELLTVQHRCKKEPWIMYKTLAKMNLILNSETTTLSSRA